MAKIITWMLQKKSGCYNWFGDLLVPFLSTTTKKHFALRKLIEKDLLGREDTHLAHTQFFLKVNTHCAPSKHLRVLFILKKVCT